MNITFKDGSVKAYDAPVTAAQVAKDLSMGLYKAACLAKIDGENCDLRTVIDRDCTLSILTFDDPGWQKGVLAYGFTHSGSGGQASLSGRQACHRTGNRQRLLL